MFRHPVYDFSHLSELPFGDSPGGACGFASLRRHLLCFGCPDGNLAGAVCRAEQSGPVEIRNNGFEMATDVREVIWQNAEACPVSSCFQEGFLVKFLTELT